MAHKKKEKNIKETSSESVNVARECLVNELQGQRFEK